MVTDKSYRDKVGARMADERVQKCLMTWYFSVRRTPTKHVIDDLLRLEFSVAELAYVDMEVGGYDRRVVYYFWIITLHITMCLCSVFW